MVSDGQVDVRFALSTSGHEDIREFGEEIAKLEK